jgi:hypothetical protein
MKKNWLTIVLCVVCAIVFFFVGMFYGKGTASTSSLAGRGFSSSSARGLGGSRSGSGGGFASGQVAAKDSQTITLQLPNGNSEVVFYSSSTQVIKPTAAALSDVVNGTQVMIGGTQNADGSLTAQSIQIRTASAPNGTSTQRGQ